MDRTKEALDPYDDVAFVVGGTSRQGSVRAGLAQVDAAVVVIHDAARPLASSDEVRRVVDALGDADAAIVAIPVDDTIKEVGSDRVLGTVDRSRLWRSQTPQAFDTKTLKAAHEKALEDGVTVTDDAELIERAGGTVVVVPGSARNVKITTAADLELARLLVAGGTHS